MTTPRKRTGDPTRGGSATGDSATGGSITMGDVSVAGSAVAVGHGARAENTVTGSSFAAAGAEIAALRALLTEMITSRTARAEGADAATVGAALDDLDALEDELDGDEPRGPVLSHLLGRLTATLAGVAGASDSVARIVHAVSSVAGLL